MSDSQHNAGIRITGDAKGAVDAFKQVQEEQRKLTDQTARTNAVARSGAEESRRFVEGQRAQAQALAATRNELEQYTGGLSRMTANTLAATAAEQALMSVLRGVTGLLVGGVVGALSAAALSFVSFGAAATEAGNDAEDAARRAVRAAQSMTQSTTVPNLAGVMQSNSGQIRALSTQLDNTSFLYPERKAALQAEIDELQRQQRHLAQTIGHYTSGAVPDAALSIEEATKGLVTATGELERLKRTLEDLDTAFGAKMGEVANNQVLTPAEKIAQVAALERYRLESVESARRKYDTSIGRLRGKDGADENAIAGIIEDEQRRRERATQHQERAALQGEQAYQREAESLAKLTATREAELRKLREENEEIGLSREQVQLLSIQRTEAALAMAQQRLALDDLRDKEDAYNLSLRAEVEYLKEKIELTRVANDRTRTIQAQDDRIRLALEAHHAIDAEAARSAQVFEQAVATGIMLGFRRGSGGLAQSLRQTIEGAISTAMLTPIATRIASPFGQIGAAFAGQGSLFNGLAGSLATSSFGQSMGWSSMAEDASGNLSALTPTAGFMSGASSAVGWVGLAAMLAYQSRDKESRKQLADQNFIHNYMGAKAFGKYNAGFDPIGSFYSGEMRGGEAAWRMVDPIMTSIFKPSKGDTMRTGVVGGALGSPGLIHQNWFDPQTAEGLGALNARMASQEQNLLRNLQLTPEQIGRVNAALPTANYAFGMEHTPWEQSQAFTQIQADRMNAISQALGRSIEDLTRIMSASAEQWQQAMRQMEEAAQASRDTLAGAVRGLPGQLGIAQLEDYQRALATSEAHSPLDRLAAARGIFDDTLGRARGGDLSAVQGLTGSAQSLLGIGREVYASGGEYQAMFGDVKSAITEIRERQLGLQADILKDVPLAIMQASNDQVAELKRGFASMVAKMGEMEAELRRWRNIG